MKKTLIALAALAATGAFAQSTVSIDGTLDAGYQSINYKGTTATDIGGNGSSTSQINFRGSEDLGGGLKAEFRVETDWNTVSNKANTGTSSTTGDAVSSFANGEIRVGLAGGFGRVDLGAVNYNSLSTYLSGQPFGTAIGGGFRATYVTDNGGAASAVRAENAVKYTSPSFSGFNASLYWSGKNTKANTATTFSSTIGAYNHQGNTEFGLNYANGPLVVSYSQNAIDTGDVASAGAGTTTTVRTLGGNYDFANGFKAFLLLQRVSASDSTQDRNFNSASVQYTTGAHVISALYGSGADSGTAMTGTTNGVTKSGKTVTMYGLGYDYNLSKRTAVYARYENLNDEGGWTAQGTTLPAADGNLRTRTALGLRHNF